tara:strand:- start:1303 stop:1554 length:252 start_codon:yes stop_codon:yes gene_type:complete
MLNGTLHAREDNNMSLSCSGYLDIKEGKIAEVSFKGLARTGGRDAWVTAFENAKIGEKVKHSTIDWVISFNGHNNVVAKFTPK